MVKELNGLENQEISTEQVKLPVNVNELVENLKINVADILSLDNKTQVKLFFDKLGLKNYYDFYYFESKEFNSLLTQNNGLRKFFNNLVGKENIKNSYASSNNILTFAENIGFNKLNINELKDQIISDVNNVGIKNLNDLEVYGLNKYIKTFKDNSYIKYYAYKKMSKGLSNLELSELITLHEILGFVYLDKNTIITEVITKFKQDGINYLEDLEKIKVREFREKYITTNPKFLKYIQSLGIKIKYLTKDDLFTIGESIGLKNVKVDKSKNLQLFLKSNGIVKYSDLRELGINGARDLLGTDRVSRDILKGFGVEYLQDFREDHLKRYARFVGLEGICEERESDENSIKDRMILKLSNHSVDCDYSLKLYGVYAFKTLLKEKNIGKVRYNEVNTFIKSKVGVIIPLLTLNDLDTISKILGYKELTDKEHKEKFINFLNSEGLNIDKLTRNHIKEKYWKNTQCRYFLEKSGLSNVKDLRLEHVNSMKEYLKSI
ncbi:MAG: hypothetical protein Q8K30_06220 [Candidatus Gracilibacteria bacterium]|nr:hypothetical protein [Candidatus Gracilibacteria bacterium]